jgi:hypothetical protein
MSPTSKISDAVVPSTIAETAAAPGQAASQSGGTIPQKVREGLEKAGDWFDRKLCGENHNEGVEGKKGEAESGPELSIGIESGESLKRNTEFKVKVGEDGKPQPGWLCAMVHSRTPSLSYGPVTVKKDELSAQYGPFSAGVENGNPKVGVKVGVEPAEGIEIGAEVEAKAKLLENSNPYSAGDLEVEGKAGVKVHKVEVGVKGMLHKAEILFGAHGSTSEGIKGNRERLTEASDGVEAKNIKQELQEDPGFKPEVRNHSLGAIIKEGVEEFGKVWNGIGKPLDFDQQGKIVTPPVQGN